MKAVWKIGLAVMGFAIAAYFLFTPNSSVDGSGRRPTATLDDGFSANCVYPRSNVAYVGGDTQEIRVIDCSDINDLEVRGTVPLSGVPLCLDGIDEFLYAASEAGGLDVLDISSPMAPVPIGQESSFRDIRMIKVHKGVAVALGARNDVYILDLSEPARPKRIATYNTGNGFTRNAIWRENFLILSAGLDGAQVLDLTYPISPVFKTLIGLGKGASGAGLVDSTLILSSEFSPAKYFDFSDPVTPKELGEVSEVGNGVMVHGDRVFFKGNRGGQVYDFSNPQSPVKIEEIQGGLGDGAVIFEDLLFDPRGPKGLRVFDLSEEMAS